MSVNSADPTAEPGRDPGSPAGVPGRRWLGVWSGSTHLGRLPVMSLLPSLSCLFLELSAARQ